MPLSDGSRLGSYEIVSRLGAGGMGEVYRARDSRLARDVAIKVLPEATAADPAALARFEREARAVASLSHPNILAIHDFGTEAGVAYAVTELLEGESLRQRLDRGAMPPRRAAEIARGIALGLAAAHEKGLVHRDLKPDNLFLTKDGTPKILDFGLARQLRRAGNPADHTLTDHTEPGVLLGTVGYMSPEQVRGEPADYRSDIFSFGAVLYEMLSGKRAFKGETSVETMNAILREEPPSISEVSRPIPQAFERIVAHCLEKQSADRFQSARDLAFDLGALSTATSVPDGRAIPGKRRWPGRMAAAVALAAASGMLFWAGVRFGPGLSKAPEPTFRRLTTRRGNVLSARFTPDGKTAVYSAAWEAKPAELYSVRTDSIESTPLGIEKAAIVSISQHGELAILRKTIRLRSTMGSGTLAQLPLGGDAPKELLRDVITADWAPDGREMAVVRVVEDRPQLEYPVGRVLKTNAFHETSVRVSPDGALVATVDDIGNGPELVVFDRNGTRRALAASTRSIRGFAWAPDGSEVYFIGGTTGESEALRAASLSGRQRMLLPAVGSSLILHDVSRDGRILLERTSRHSGASCFRAGESAERDISWAAGSQLRDAPSNDGQALLFSDDAGSRAITEIAYLRRCDGSPPIRLGEGQAVSLSPEDAQWAMVVRGSDLWVLPTGPGSPRKIPLGGIKAVAGAFLPGGKRIAVWHYDAGERPRLSVTGIEGGPVQAVSLPNFRGEGVAPSPDGEWMAYDAKDGSLMAASLSGGAARPLPGPPVDRDDQIATWSGDGRYLYLVRVRSGMPGIFFRREIATGKTSRWLEFQPADLTGVTEFGGAGITPDGRSYAYTYERVEASDLFVVDGLR